MPSPERLEQRHAGEDGEQQIAEAERQSDHSPARPGHDGMGKPPYDHDWAVGQGAALDHLVGEQWAQIVDWPAEARQGCVEPFPFASTRRRGHAVNDMRF
jgi:hypothetical protein